MLDENKTDGREEEELEGEEFGELIKYTAGGFIGGVLLGLILDHFGLQKSGVGQWLVRTISGEGESIFEGIFSIRQRVLGKSGSMAEAYGWGKLFGMVFPWLIDWGSRFAGVDIYGIQGFYIPFFYALSDQIGGNVSGFLFLKKREKSLGAALTAYIRHPAMIAGVTVIFVVPVGLLGARIAGFSPTTQFFTAMETIAANLCWLPPMVGWLAERKRGET